MRKPPILLLVAICTQMTPALHAQSVSVIEAFPNLTFTQPILLTHPPDVSDRIFVVQQDGHIFVFPNDSAVTTAKPFLTITSKLSDYTIGGEEGLLGLAFHPQFKTNGYFYINYTAPNPLRTVIERYRVQSQNPDAADTASAYTILEIDQPPAPNHKGGNLAFGPDGYLYAGTGDGGGANDTYQNSQNKASLLGKFLRIDVNDTTATTHYKIPPDNPLVGNTSGWKEELWVWGMRNPWRWSFDPATGILWCGDVGQDTWEEVDIIKKGLNYGWPIMEGLVCNPIAPVCDTTGLTLPIAVFGHDVGNAIVGGYVYRGYRAPWLTGAYIYGDYGSGKIWMLRYDNGSVTADSLLVSGGLGAISSFGTDQLNELYIVGYGSSSSIYRFAGPGPTTAVKPGPSQAQTFRLDQNYPNPFNPSTQIGYQVPRTGRVLLKVYDILGQQVSTLVDRVQSAGSYQVSFDGAQRASGVYIYRITTASGSITRTMVLTR